MGTDASDHQALTGAPAGLTPATQHGGPTVQRILLGAQLRRLREAGAISRTDAAEAIRATHSKISRLELGRSSFKQRDVADLLTLYGITDEQEREILLTLARQASTPGWWHQYNDVIPAWLEPYVGLEEAASVIRNYEVQFVPGLLQTADYARAVIRLRHAKTPAAEVERRVDLRMRRQRRLTQADAPRLWAVVDEAALRRPLGGRQVLCAQLRHLIDLTTFPNITLQVVPLNNEGHAAAGGPFTILRFPAPDLPDVIYLEQLTSALYLDKPHDIEDYTHTMDQLSLDAAPPEQTRRLLTTILAESTTSDS